MDNPGEILRLCRLCLVKDQVNIPIFEEQGDIRQIFLKISSCLPVKVSRDDKLPKKICDGCSNKLDLLYDFWNSSANAEKTLLSWLGQAGVKDADETISAVAQQIAKPAETQVKQEALEDGHAASQAQSYGVQSFDEEAKDESEAPPPKRARRTAAVKAQISITPESDDDDDMDSAEAMTKVEDESDESDGEDKDPSYAEVPGTSADDQAGPSGVGKDGVEAPPINQCGDDVIVLSDDDEIDKTNLPRHRNIYGRSFRYSSSEDDSEDDIIHVDDIEGRTVTKAEADQSADEMNYRGKKLIKQLYCNKCGDLFNDFVLLHRHIFTKNHVFSCEKCYKKIGHTLSQLREHVKMDCNKDKVKSEDVQSKADLNVLKYYCERCGQGFSVLAKLTEHYKIHVNELICCPLCPIRSAAFDGIMAHFKSHTVINNIELSCKICDLHFYAIHPYRMHSILVHSNFVNIPYNCILCTQIFKDHKEFLWHVQSHTKLVFKTKMNPHRPDKNVTNMTCEICAEIFDDTDSCKEHKDVCHDINSLRQAKEPCVVCSQIFTIMELPSHMSQHEEMDTKDLCEDLQQKNDSTDEPHSFTTLQENKKKSQSKVKCYTCKEMVLLATIEEHRESHKFKCNLCPRSFNTHQGLNQHIISHTNVEKKQLFQESNNEGGFSLAFNQPTCNDCGRVFLSLYALREHSKIHTIDTRENMSAWSSPSLSEDFTGQTPQNAMPGPPFRKRSIPPLKGNSKNSMERIFYDRGLQNTRQSSYGSHQKDNGTKPNPYFGFRSEPNTGTRSFSGSYNDNIMVKNPFSENSSTSLIAPRSEFSEDQSGNYRYQGDNRGKFGSKSFRR